MGRRASLHEATAIIEIECAIALDLINIKETPMKSITLIKQVVFATMLLSATVTAFAAGGGSNGLGRNPNLYAPSLTRYYGRGQRK